MRCLIAQRLRNLSDGHFDKVSFSVARWFEKASELIKEGNQELFENIWDRLVSSINTSENANTSALIRETGEIDWATEALNSTAGELAELHIRFLSPPKNKKARKLPREWSYRAEELLNLPSPSRQYALVFLAHQLHYLFWYDRDWVSRNLLNVLDAGGCQEDVEAFWAGFFWGARLPQERLFKWLKPHLISIATNQVIRRRRHGEILGGILLAGWRYTKRGKRLVSSEEMHAVILEADNSFRSNVLWQLDRWSQNNDDWSASLVEFINDVWPKQKKARNPEISERFVQLAIHHPDRFPIILGAVYHLLNKVDQNSTIFFLLRKGESGIVDRFPVDALKLMHAILPDDVSRWPYEAQTVVRQLSASAPELNSLPEMLELLGRMEGV